VFENRVLRRIFGPKIDEVTGEWRRIHNEEINELYCSPNIWVVKLSKMRWMGHIAHMVREEAHTGFWWENLRQRDHLEDPGKEWRIILQ
jgi:hypothetical protein